jgi:hypothetical protein
MNNKSRCKNCKGNLPHRVEFPGAMWHDFYCSRECWESSSEYAKSERNMDRLLTRIDTTAKRLLMGLIHDDVFNRHEGYRFAFMQRLENKDG